MTEARKDPALGSAGNDSTQIHSHQEAERLRDQLADFFEEMTVENYDGEKLDKILDALDAVDPMPEFTSNEESLAAFHEKYASLFAFVEAANDLADTNKSQTNTKNITIETSPKKTRSRKLIKLLPLAAVLVILLGSITAQAFGFGSIFDLFSRWTTEWFHVGGEETPNAVITLMPLEEGEKAEYDSLQEALDAFGISAPMAPTWVPERFELEKVTAVCQPTHVLIYADYVSGEECLLIQYREITPDSHSFEKEGAEVSSETYMGIRHYLMPNLEQYDACWQNGDFNCSITGDVSEAEMKEIVKSIYKGE